ncbi:MAG: two-component system response regulator [Chloroflexi bacterium RBG_16_57_11]|nr:MAG: two-component system response regulator [Chloroflexi bacterium RBG_16_57_11]
MEAKTSKKILIVEDEAYIRLLIEQTLEELEEQGVEILKADNGEDALRLIQNEGPQLVFLDVMIPKINGFEVCRIVKRELQMENIMIVILTAKGQEYDYQTGQEAGANLYITKPFDPDELLDLATKVFSDDDPNYIK